MTNKFQTLKQIENQHIAFVLTKSEGNISEAAKILDVGRATLYRKIEEVPALQAARLIGRNTKKAKTKLLRGE